MCVPAPWPDPCPGSRSWPGARSTRPGQKVTLRTRTKEDKLHGNPLRQAKKTTNIKKYL